jgi:leucyl-tRNA synthetase
MSKSKGNVISPDDMVARYGADATRMYALFAAPPDRDLDWQEDGVAGVSRFLARVWRLADALQRKAREVSSSGISLRSKPLSEMTEAETKLLGAMHRTIAKITDEFSGRWHFNTCIASIMTFVNLLSADSEHWVEIGEISEAAITEILRSLVLLLAPLAPFLAEELWEKLGYEGPVFRAPWPKSDPALAKEDEIEIPVQINGKLVTVVLVPADADAKAIEAAALADEKVKARIAGKTLVKVIVVPGRAVNLVVK